MALKSLYVLFASKATKLTQTFLGGIEGDRTPDLRNAIATLSQLSYDPISVSRLPGIPLAAPGEPLAARPEDKAIPEDIPRRRRSSARWPRSVRRRQAFLFLIGGCPGGIRTPRHRRTIDGLYH